MRPPRSRRGRSGPAIVLLALLAAGCGGPAPGANRPEGAGAFGPNGGPVAALPGGGAVEVAAESSGGAARLVARFFASDALDAPLSPAPTDVRVDLAMPGGTSVPVTLPAAAGEAAVFRSSPGDYVVDPLVGTLHATIGGQPASVAFSGAQN